MTHICAYEHDLAKIYHDAVRSIPGVRVWGPDFAEGRVRAPTVSITLERATAAEAAKALDDQDICVWDGDFYASRPVQVLGLVERGGLLRTGISMYNTRDEVNRLLAGIEKLA
jgi:selenocysteine lyase/cysteine desulfurase